MGTGHHLGLLRLWMMTVQGNVACFLILSSVAKDHISNGAAAVGRFNGALPHDLTEALHPAQVL